MTKDGGRTWAQVANLTAQYGKIDFADQQTGWLTDTSGSLQATADGGRTWTSLSVGTR
ncbi:MAG: Photosynthesis system assembly factor [Firmicutes bacterium]|nr:Photosynthesis system assembly factor [Bacillota bacterium]